MGAALELRDVELALGREQVLGGVGFAVAPGELACLLGPSGCGKSTILRILGGLAQGYAGEVRVADAPPAAGWRRLAYVFQTARLVPWRDVLGNALLGLELRDPACPPAEKRRRALHYLDMVGLADAAGKHPGVLSGGERHRVAIARALAVEPDILLMDEPFANLDVHSRERLREALRDVWKATGKTVLFVTHDIHEAADLGTRLLVLSDKPARILEDLQLNPGGARGLAESQRRQLLRRVRAALFTAAGGAPSEGVPAEKGHDQGFRALQGG